MKTKQLQIHVPVDFPGRTVIERTRGVIAAGYAEARYGPEASPQACERGAARLFRIVKVDIAIYHGTQQKDETVTIEGPERAIDEYAKILEAIS